MKFIKQDKTAAILADKLTKKLVEIKNTISVAAGSSTSFTSLVNSTSFEIKTVYAKADTGDPITLSIWDNIDASASEVYRSLTVPVINDIVAVPYMDKSGDKRICVRVNNSGANTVNVNVLIKVVTF